MPPPHRAASYRVEPFDLRLFAAVLEHGTITAAADAVNLSLAAASARLKSLEHAVGVRLLERSKAGAAPTAAGRAFARHAQRLLAELDALHVEMAAFGHGLRGTIRLLCNTAAMAEALPPRLGAFLAAHPDIDIDLRELSSDAVVDAVRGGAADLGIVADYVDTTGLQTQVWLPDPLVALLPSAIARGRRGAPRFAELLALPFVGLAPESGLSRFLLREASRIGRVPHHRVRVSGFDAAAQVVAAGVGVAIMPLAAAERWRHDAALRILPLADRWAKRQLLLCHAANAGELPGVGALISALCSPAPRGRQRVVGGTSRTPRAARRRVRSAA